MNKKFLILTILPIGAVISLAAFLTIPFYKEKEENPPLLTPDIMRLSTCITDMNQGTTQHIKRGDLKAIEQLCLNQQ